MGQYVSGRETGRGIANLKNKQTKTLVYFILRSPLPRRQPVLAYILSHTQSYGRCAFWSLASFSEEQYDCKEEINTISSMEGTPRQEGREWLLEGRKKANSGKGAKWSWTLFFRQCHMSRCEGTSDRRKAKPCVCSFQSREHSKQEDQSLIRCEMKPCGARQRRQRELVVSQALNTESHLKKSSSEYYSHYACNSGKQQKPEKKLRRRCGDSNSGGLDRTAQASKDGLWILGCRADCYESKALP